MKYVAIDKGDGEKEELTRDNFIERIAKGRNVEGMIQCMETGCGINHSNKYETDFYIYEVER